MVNCGSALCAVWSVMVNCDSALCAVWSVMVNCDSAPCAVWSIVVNCCSALCAVQTVLQTLIGTVDQDSAANYCLLLMWASLANAIPVCSSIEYNNQHCSYVHLCVYQFIID